MLSFQTEPAQNSYNNITTLASILLVEKYFLAPSFPDVCIVCMLFLTIPVTVASCERSFSKLKLIKNYLYIEALAMSQERLSGLAMLSIENTRAKKLNVSNIIDVFADRIEG